MIGNLIFLLHQLDEVSTPHGAGHFRRKEAGLEAIPLTHLSSLKALCQEVEPDENMKARKTLPPDSYLSIGSFPVISSPSKRHENIPEVCRIHSSIPKGIMTLSRLHLPGSTLIQCSITIPFPRALLKNIRHCNLTGGVALSYYHSERH